MNDRDLRRRIDDILDRYDRLLLQHWSQRIVLTAAAAGLALGLSACPPELMPPGPGGDAVVQPAQPAPDINPGIRNEYGVEPDRVQPRLPDAVPVAKYAARMDPRPEPQPRFDPGPATEYGIREPRPIAEPIQAQPGVDLNQPRPAYAVPPPDPKPFAKYAVPNFRELNKAAASQPAEPDMAPVARYAVRMPRPSAPGETQILREPTGK